MRMHAIVLKTLTDLFSVRRSILFLIVVLILPVIGSGIFNESMQISSMSLAMQDQTVLGFFIIISFLWIVGIPVVLMAGITCGDFISKEDQDGTLLMLVSKPIRRYEIVIGKFAAFMISSIILEITSILASALIFSSSLGIDVYTFNNIISLVPSLLAYSVFVAFIFGAMATALSSMFRSRIKTIMIVVGLTMLIFFGFMIARGWLGNNYEGMGFNYMDVNYHLGNAYLFFLDASGYRMAPLYQGMLGMFTGTYDISNPGSLYDIDIGAMPPEIAPKNYTTPLQSMLIWSGISVAMMALGLLLFERRDIS